MAIESIKVRVSTPTEHLLLGRGFYQVDDGTLFVQIGPFQHSRHFFSYLESESVRIDIDCEGRPIFIEVGLPRQRCRFQTINFDFDKFNLRSDARSSLDFNYNLLRDFPDVIVKIEGHCDERGTVEYNLSLGEKRAKAAQDYLVGLGVTANRISIISYGKERPIDTGHTEDAWAKNRRCEFRIVSQ